jgi:hypothetical protein
MGDLRPRVGLPAAVLAGAAASVRFEVKRMAAPGLFISGIMLRRRALPGCYGGIPWRTKLW